MSAAEEMDGEVKEMETECCAVEKHGEEDEGGTSMSQQQIDEVVAAEQILNAMLFYRRYGITKIHLSITSFQILKEIIAWGVGMFGDDFALRTAVQMTQQRPSSDHYMTKVKSTLKQIMRDWSTEGEAERKSCYTDVMRILRERFPDKEKRDKVEILVPGAGLGRLAWELVAEGFSVQGNEFSILMLLTSNFILNKCKQANEYVIYPFVLDTCNNWSYEDQLRPVRFPDICPLIPDERPNTFSMCAGEFLDAMKDTSERWDVIVTVFFIDTAVNVLDYIDTIHRVLKKGGVWINFGPLTYHFANGEADGAIELPYDLIIRYINQKGFKFVSDERAGKTSPALYACNQKSMLRYQYICGFFECTKL